MTPRHREPCSVEASKRSNTNECCNLDSGRCLNDSSTPTGCASLKGLECSLRSKHVLVRLEDVLHGAVYHEDENEEKLTRASCSSVRESPFGFDRACYVIVSTT